MSKVIDSFRGEYRWLSNFVGGSEERYQSNKTLDVDEWAAIRNAPTPGKAKRLGNKCTLRPDWNKVRLAIMLDALQHKFQWRRSTFSGPGPDARHELAQKLVDTGDAILIEGNTWHDNFWGNCTCPKCKDKPGANWLGRLLMLRRSQLLAWKE